MVQIFDTDPKSNEYFFITGLDEDILGAGKNSLFINCTDRVLIDRDITVSAVDVAGNTLSTTQVQLFGPRANFQEARRIYSINVPASTPAGVGKIEIHGTAIDLGGYTGKYAFYRGKAYPVTSTQKLPLLQPPPGVSAFPEAELVWSRNVLVDSSNQTSSEVRFFDQPDIAVTPRIYNTPEYPTSSYALATGSCAGVSLYPKNNDSRNFDASAGSSQYQLFRASGTEFSAVMEGEYVRIKNPFVNSFTYANYSNNQINFRGVLNTDFVAKIVRVVNSDSVLVDIPFATVSDLIGRINEDSPYNRNNLVDYRGYDISDEPDKQSVYLKKNFYVLSIGSADYEVVYKNVPVNVPLAEVTGSSFIRKSVIDVEFNGLRTHCGHVSSYKIYAKSLNSPETKVLLAEGKAEPDEHLYSNNFNNGLYNSPGRFFNQSYLARFWITSSAALTLSQSNGVFAAGAYIGHANNEDETAYVIFKDDTSGTTRTPAYVSYTFGTASHWYATTDAFLNADAQPSSSYGGIVNVPVLFPYAASQENLLNGQIYDSNPIKLRKSTLYKFTMRAKPANSRSPGTLKVYFVSGTYKKQIATIDNSLEDIDDGLYSSTFFSDTTKYGTIILVPVGGYWHIGDLSLKPHQASDYSIDSFKAKYPLQSAMTNELFEIEAELYDHSGKLAYGNGSYTFNRNKMLRPLTKRFFVNPAGIVSSYGGGQLGVLILDGGDAYTVYS